MDRATIGLCSPLVAAGHCIQVSDSYIWLQQWFQRPLSQTFTILAMFTWLYRGTCYLLLLAVKVWSNVKKKLSGKGTVKKPTAVILSFRSWNWISVGPKSSTFFESSWREVSHCGTLDMCCNIKISSNLLKSKKTPFFAFLGDTLQKKFKWPPIGQYRSLAPCP